MRAKTLILLFVALGCGMIAAVAVSKAVMDNQSGQVEEATSEIFVAAKDLQQAEQIGADDVKLEKWPQSRIPEGAIFTLDELENKFTKQNIFNGEPILTRKINDSRESFSTTLPAGYRIFDIEFNASYIKPGDYVDILGTFRPGGRTAPPESRTVMRNVKVHGINGSPTRDSSDEDNAPKSVNRSTVFQLLVKESQLEALTLARSEGELQLNLRPFGEDLAEFEDDAKNFVAYLNAARGGDDEDEEPVAPSFPVYTPTADDDDKHTMLLVTPNGIRKFQWTDEDPLPAEVVPEEDSEPSSFMPANGYAGPSGNVYSGYGGYSPTYPTSTSSPLEPVNGGEGAVESDVPPSSSPVN
ncbi:MAG: Flp pilus assembly protein CpaB [Planctomycetota bacterium]